MSRGVCIDHIMVVLFVLPMLLAVASANLHVHEEPLLHRSSLTSRVENELNYRLPTNIKPISYNITLTPHIIEGNFTFDGEIEIEFSVLQVTNEIVLHANNLTIDKKSIKLTNALTIYTVKNITENTDLHFYTVHLTEPLEPSNDIDKYILTIAFVGYLDVNHQGFYRSSYRSGDDTRWLAVTQFQTTDARKAFPCFDEPALKATFTIHICRNPEMHSISNMPLKSTTKKGALECDHFEESPLMSTYLVAFAVSDFEYLYNSKKKFRIFAQPSKIEQAMYSFSVSPSILQWLEDYTKINYTLPKMDKIAVPDFDAGAMENWGLVTYKESSLLFEEGVSTSEDKQMIATVIAHEYAHQWFGNLVSPHWWKDSWLNEGFATYFEYHVAAGVETTWRLVEQFVVTEQQVIMGYDASDNTQPMSHDVSNPASIEEISDSMITYQKAGSVIRMMQHIVSENTFRIGLQNYLINRSHDVATPEHLFRAIEDQYIADNGGFPGLMNLSTIMNTWNNQMGYPVVHVTRDYDTFTATIKQERFLLEKSEKSTDIHDYKWFIPLTYTTQGTMDFQSTKPTLWLKADNISITVDELTRLNDWILFNIQETGYYRVNYDVRNWELLSQYLDSPALGTIHPLNRAQLIDDSFNLAKAGIVDYSIFLNLSRYLAREVDFVPWYSAFRALKYIDDKLNTRGEDYLALQEYFAGLLTKVYEQVGSVESLTDDHVTRLIRPQVVEWACSMGVPSCTNMARAHIKSWMTTGKDSSQMSTNERTLYYCSSFRHANESEWNFLRQEYEGNSSDISLYRLTAALHCTQNKAILESYMTDLFTPSSIIKMHHAPLVCASVFQSHLGADIGLDFLINQWHRGSNFFIGLRGSSAGSILNDIAWRLNTRTQVDKLKAFIANYDELQRMDAVSVQKAIDTIEENIKWQDRFGDQIIAWVKNELAAKPMTTEVSS